MSWTGEGLALCALSVGVCVLLLACVARGVRGERERRIVRAWASPARSRDRARRARRLNRVEGSSRKHRHRGRASGTPSARELSLLITEVATRLRSGCPVDEAWRSALARMGVAGKVGQCEAYPPILDAWVGEPHRRRLRWKGSSPQDAAARVSAASVTLACRFSRELGAPLADVLDVIGGAIDDAQAVEEARRVASAGPLMSARVLSAFPLVGITCAYALGSSPWSFYVGGGAGSACALLGVAAWAAGVVSCRRILARARRVEGRGVDGALACDLIASGLACGAAIPRALEALARSCGTESIAWTARALRLGARWEDAWEDAPQWAQPLSEALEASWIGGSAPEMMLARCASWERRTRLADAKARAEELGVRLVGPLGMFFLPAFLTLGIGPILAHLLGGIDV